MLTKVGIEKIRDLIYDELSTGEFGDDGTETSESDTDLSNAVAGTSASLTLTKFPKGISAEHTLTTASGNGNSLREYGVKTTGSILVSHAVFPQIDKTSSIELNTSTQLLFIQNEEV